MSSALPIQFDGIFMKLADKRANLGFLIGTILALFFIYVTLMLPTKFGVNIPFSSGEAKNRFFKTAAMAATLDFQSE